MENGYSILCLKSLFLLSSGRNQPGIFLSFRHSTEHRWLYIDFKNVQLNVCLFECDAVI